MNLNYIHVSSLFGDPLSEEKMGELALALSKRAALCGRVSEINAIKNIQKRAESLAGLYLLSLFEGLPSGELKRTEQGRPFFAGAKDFDFNISHSEGLAVCVTDTGRVGADVERLRPIKDALGLAARYFSPSERELIEKSEDKSEAFLRAWTKSEAYAKYTGEGLANTLGTPDFSESIEFCEKTLFVNGEAYLVCICKKVN